MIRRIILLMTFAACGILHAASSLAETADEMWIGYHQHYTTSPTFKWYGDAGYRLLLEDQSWMRFHVRPCFRKFDRRRIEWHGGMGLFYTYRENIVNQLEIRPWGGVRYRWPKFDFMSFTQFLRVEVRFLFESDHRNDATTRLRYKVATSIPLQRGRAAGYFFVPVGAEAFFDITETVLDTFSDELRLEAGIGYVLSSTWSGEFQLMWQRNRSAGDEIFDVNELILRFEISRYLVASLD